MVQPSTSEPIFCRSSSVYTSKPMRTWAVRLVTAPRSFHARTQYEASTVKAGVA